MKRVVSILLAVLTLAAVAFVLSHIPFPSSKAREAIGKHEIINVVVSDPPGFLVGVNKSGKGKPVYMVPSAGREASDFNELAIALNNAGYKTITIEPPLINGSKPFFNYHTMSSISFYLDIAISHDQPIILIGHAFGNRVVRTYAAEHPDRVKAVILLAAGGETEIDPVANKALKNVFNPLASFKQRKKDIAYAFFAEGNDIPEHWLKGWHTKTAILQGKAKSQIMDSKLSDMPSYDKLVNGKWQGAGGVPMLVLQPAQDRIAPKEVAADYLAAHYPDQVEVVVIENAGHALLPEQPEAVANAVIEFLDRQSEK